MQRSFDTTSREATTPRESFTMPRLSRTKHGEDYHLSHGSKGMSSSHDNPTRCLCLWTIRVLLEELEKNNNPADPAALDTNLSSQKQALARCKTILKCSTCVARSEYILILGLIAQRLVTSYEASVSVYMQGLQRRSSIRVESNGIGRSQIRSEESEKVFLGHYEIDSPEEWSSLIRVIICLQLREFQTLLADMKDAAADGPKAAEMPVVRATERRIASLIYKLRQPVPQSD